MTTFEHHGSLLRLFFSFTPVVCFTWVYYLLFSLHKPNCLLGARSLCPPPHTHTHTVSHFGLQDFEERQRLAGGRLQEADLQEALDRLYGNFRVWRGTGGKARRVKHARDELVIGVSAGAHGCRSWLVVMVAAAAALFAEWRRRCRRGACFCEGFVLFFSLSLIVR